MIKQVGGLKKYLYYFIFVIFLFCNKINAYQIYDFQTEKFLEKLNLKILSVNNYNKEIKLKIIKNDFPNAFIDANSILHITSGLIIHSPDYVSLLAVLAHEIGHLENYHVSKRINELKSLKKITSLGSIAAIAGTMLMQEPDLINTVVINQTAIKNFYLNFSQDQEKEADFYSVDTLRKLNLSTNSVKEFLLILENKTKFNLVDNEIKRFSTHPLFSERYEILDTLKNDNSDNFNQNLQNEFDFIKAKFMAYSNTNFSIKLYGDQRIYYEAIKYTLSGNLSEGLKKLNNIISKRNNNIFLLETKADILLSYGYNKESLKFYKKVLESYPQNNYARFNFFINSNYTDEINIKDIYFNNLNLISLFPYNKKLFKKYLVLSQILEYDEWTLLFEIILFETKDLKQKLVELNLKSKDSNLKNIIKLYI